MEKNKYYIKRDREVVLTPSSWIPCSYSSPLAREVYGITLSWTRLFFQGDRMLGVHLQKELEEVENIIAAKIFSDNNYFREIAGEISRRKEILLELFEKLRKTDYDFVYRFSNHQSLQAECYLQHRRLVSLCRKNRSIENDYF